MSDSAPTPCETCHGRGWHPEETEESKRADDVYNYDYREAYCSCPAGERLRKRDGGEQRTNLGGEA